MAIAPNVQELPPAQDGEPAREEMAWPSERAGFYALFVIILATFLNFFDTTVFAMLAERIKGSFNLSDSALGFVLGPASVVAFVFVGIPLARLVDLYPRKLVLSASIAVLGTITALGGLAQSFGQLIGSRLFVGAGGAANGPGSYSMMADYFRPMRIPLVFALMQLSYVLASALGTWGGGRMIAWTDTLPETSSFAGLTIFSWQWILIIIGVPGLLTALLFLTVKEPPRRNPAGAKPLVPSTAPLGRRILAFTGLDALKAINLRGAVYWPLFIALGMSAIESQGLPAWRVPFIARTYGWTEAEIGNLLAPLLLGASLAGLLIGGFFVSWMNKRHKDGNIRATAIIFSFTTVFAIAAPLMPTAELALGCMAMTTLCGLAGAPAQNAAIQRIAPNEMRGQVTALYLFMYTFFGAMGSFVIGTVSDLIVGDPAKLWEALLIVAAIFMPLATFFMWRAIKPYREEVMRLEAQGI
ncbi:MFS family permease [Altererythrobacter atlanticus]|uniref:Enterobactin exporter EntS n=1 Tax=Croceibacterium atlanticum TaxID=1267766 RepID=A0A0F7KTX0_9SPHN|nr:MFS transporter [Croceibacterium atlanticum]AKH43823.1 enterobactin exporter EntS [Croceibacterium atlanticum]MBB5733727.1 MFS family permease [Croceibacterium atlanticum]